MNSISDVKLGDDTGRVAALHRYDVLDVGPQQGFDDIVTLLKAIFSVPFAAITLIDSRRLWIKSAAGMECSDFPREDTFCDITIQGTHVLAVENTTKDARFANLALVTGEGHIRCYIGTALTTPDGYNIGSVCLFGQEAREFSEGEKAILKSFANVVVSQLELRHSATVDGLTGAMSRRGFEDKLGQSVEQENCSLLLFDIDHFKSVNDTYGHSVGDDVLSRVAEVARCSLRPTDTFGRIGGEEFGVLLRETGAVSAEAVAEKLRENIAALRTESVRNKPITVSIGVAHQVAGETIQEWLQRADTAMYHAKRSGRNRVVAWPICDGGSS